MLGVRLRYSSIWRCQRGGTLCSFDIGLSEFTSLHDFVSENDGSFPSGVAVMQSEIMGTAYFGGANNDDGTLSSFVVPEPASQTLGAMCCTCAV